MICLRLKPFLAPTKPKEPSNSLEFKKQPLSWTVISKFPNPCSRCCQPRRCRNYLLARLQPLESTLLAPIPLWFGHSISKNQRIQKRIYLKGYRSTPGTRAAQNLGPSAEVAGTTRNTIPKKHPTHQRNAKSNFAEIL